MFKIIKLLLLLSSIAIIGLFSCRMPKPTRSYLFNFLKNADIVFIGKIEKIEHDANSGSVTSIQAWWKRIYKGRDVLNNRNPIQIENVSENEPCSHRLWTTEYRVFAIRVTNNQFQLSSPTIRVNLNVLDSLHTLSIGRAHRKRRKAKPVVCESIICPFGSKCSIHSGKCECKSKCRSVDDIVCGNDNVSYMSMCHLSVRSCMLQKSGSKQRLRVASKGPCHKRNPCDDLRCGPGEECVVEQTNGILSAKCICPTECPNYGDSIESSAVCSNHGVDYQSACHLRHHACDSKTNITIKYYGRCDPCANHKCERGMKCYISSDRRPECGCDEQCSIDDYSPVCATDGKTYSNECMMRLTACKERKVLEVWKRMKCEDTTNPCANLKCYYSAECQIDKTGKASCDCPQECEKVMRPVCATNGETFENECQMKRKSCETKSLITVKHQGTCGAGACASYQDCPKPKVCVEIDGKPRCQCPKCGDELKEVCGSDGKTYSNECKLRQAACKTGKSIYIKYNSICHGCESKKCEFYSSCVAVQPYKPVCKCPDDCGNKKDEAKYVCGTDGVTYYSECHLRKSACRRKKFIVVAFEGKCDACLHVQCQYGEECRAGVCSCSYSCPVTTHESDRVCGETGIIYDSECHLQLASCQRGSPIAEMPMQYCLTSKKPSLEMQLGTLKARIKYDLIGWNDNKCKICNISHPNYGICGSNGIIYRNQCHLNTISCRDQVPINVLPFLAMCTANHGKCNCHELGAQGRSCDVNGQCRCKPGVGGLKCEHCLPMFWGLHRIATGEGASCQPCGCSAFGSARLDCNQLTGVCECKEFAMGDKCDRCQSGYIMTPSGCVVAANYRAPRDCSQLVCHHGATCVPVQTSLPDCSCPQNCLPSNFPDNITICASDGNTYANECELRMFACKHQIDVVPISLGFCDKENLEILERLERDYDERDGERRLGSSCNVHEHCQKLNAVCVYRPGRNGVCECDDGWRSDAGICVEIFKNKKPNQIIMTMDGKQDWFINLPTHRLMDPVDISIKNIRSDGTVMRLWTADSNEVEVIAKEKRVIIKLGRNESFVSAQTIGADIELEITWIRHNLYMKLNGEMHTFKYNMNIENSVVRRMYLLSDGEWKANRLKATLMNLMINEKSIREDAVKSHYLPPPILDTIRFEERGSILIKNLDIDVRANSMFEVEFQTNSSNGLLFYWSSGRQTKSRDFVSIFLIDAKPHFVIELGSGMSYLRGNKIGLNQLVKLKVMRSERNSTLFINDVQIASQESHGKQMYLDIDGNNNNFFIGYVPNESMIVRKVRKINKPFVGEIQAIRLNEMPLNLEENIGRIEGTRLTKSPTIHDCKKLNCVGACYERNEEPVCRKISSNRGVHLTANDELSYANQVARTEYKSMRSNFSFDFRTINANGVLWFEGGWSFDKADSDFLVIFIGKHYLSMAINLGNDRKLKVISTNTTVTDNHWHTVMFKRNKRSCELWLDGKHLLAVVTSPGDHYLNTNGIVFLGGRLDASTHHQLSTFGLHRKFVGCVKSLQIFGEHVDLITDSLSRPMESPNYCYN